MKSLTRLAVASLVAGCSAGTGGLGPDTKASPQDPSSAPPGAAPHDTTVARPPAHPIAAIDTIEANLAQLRALQIFDVFGDVENRNCYAGPCIDDPSTAFEAKVPAEVRVADFTSRALAAAANPASDAYASLEGTVAQDHVAYLRSLQVAMIGELVLAQPNNN